MSFRPGTPQSPHAVVVPGRRPETADANSATSLESTANAGPTAEMGVTAGIVLPQSLQHFVFGLLTNIDARAGYEADPQGALDGAGLNDVTPADVQDIVPLVADYVPVQGVTVGGFGVGGVTGDLGGTVHGVTGLAGGVTGDLGGTLDGTVGGLGVGGVTGDLGSTVHGIGSIAGDLGVNGDAHASVGGGLLGT